MSRVFKEVCQLPEIDQTRTTPYHPMSDGLVERLNRTIQQMLKGYVQEMKDDWEDHLPYILMAYRSSVQETTGCSPNLLMLGREVALPLDILVGSPTPVQSKCMHEYVEWLKKAMTKAFTFAREKMKLGVARQKRNYGRKARENTFVKGDWVWVYDFPESRQKLGKPWVGPCLVLECLSEVTCKIQRSPNSKAKVVHINHLKKLEGSPPSWGTL